MQYTIYKNGVYQYNDSIDICGYYEISMNDFNGDCFPDIQLDLRCGNNHTESYVFIWNNTFNRFVNKINETFISFIKPNYFVSFNNNNVSEYQYDIYKILEDTSYIQLKSFLIFFDSSYMYAGDTIIFTNKPFEVIDEYIEKVKNTH